MTGEIRTGAAGEVGVVTQALPWCESVALGVWIDAGSVDEAPGEYGVAHLLEHVVFRRTASFTGREISERADELGADLNAFTGREHTCVHVQVPADGLEEAAELLFALVGEWAVTDEDVALEREIVLDELAARADDPEDLGTDLVTEAVLGAGALGHPVIGTEDSVAALDLSTLTAFRGRAWGPGSMVVAAAGDVDHEALCRLVARSPLPGAGEPGGFPAPRRPRGTVAADTRDAARRAPLEVRQEGEQLQVVLGRRTPGRSDPRRAAARIAATVLGGGPSSRLFQQIREDRGLAYSVYAGIDQFRPAGVLTATAGCPADRGEELLVALGGVLAGLAETPPTDAEVRRAVGAVCGGLRLGLDDPMERMYRLGRQVLDRGAATPVSESLDRLTAVTGDDVRGYWADETSPWSLAVLGPVGRRVRRTAARVLGDLAR